MGLFLVDFTYGFLDQLLLTAIYMDRDTKKGLMEKFGVHKKDTGSSKVQVAVLTERINELSSHLETHPKDDHSRRGLLGLVGKRRKHLMYLKMHKKEEYEEVLKKLKLRK
jgi:small subunit ribosomal protein S15